jgi:hypothetical protein
MRPTPSVEPVMSAVFSFAHAMVNLAFSCKAKKPFSSWGGRWLEPTRCSVLSWTPVTRSAFSPHLCSGLPMLVRRMCLNRPTLKYERPWMNIHIQKSGHQAKTQPRRMTNVARTAFCQHRPLGMGCQRYRYAIKNFEDLGLGPWRRYILGEADGGHDFLRRDYEGGLLNQSTSLYWRSF